MFKWFKNLFKKKKKKRTYKSAIRFGMIVLFNGEMPEEIQISAKKQVVEHLTKVFDNMHFDDPRINEFVQMRMVISRPIYCKTDDDYHFECVDIKEDDEDK